MARSVNGTSEKLYMPVLTALDGVQKFTFAFWGYRPSSSASCCVSLASGQGTGGFYRISMAAHSDGNFYGSVELGAAAYRSFACNIVGWAHYAFVFDGTSGSVLFAFVDGVEKFYNGGAFGTIATSVASGANLSPCELGGDWANTGGAERWLGPASFAELGVWLAVLTSAEIVALSKGYAPSLVRPNALTYYWPLIGRTSPEVEVMRRANAVLSGTTVLEHPRILYPRRRQFLHKAGGPPPPYLYQVEPKRLRVFLTR